MSLLAELNTILDTLGVPIETGVFSGVAPDEYAVLTPLSDEFALFGDNRPLVDVSEVRISLFSKCNYRLRISQLVAKLLDADITIAARKYVGFDVGYHHFSVDCAKDYPYDYSNFTKGA